MNSNMKQLLSLFVASLLLCGAILAGVILSTQSSVEDDSRDPSFTVSDTVSDVAVNSAEESEEPSSCEPSNGESSNELPPESSTPEAEFPAALVDETVKANYVVLYDATNDEFLYERNADKRCYPASITKLLTALTACDYLNKDDVVTVGAEINMIGAGSSTAELKVGYEMTFEQLMDSMLIVSGNDSAYVMAVWAGRKILGTERGSRDQALAAFMDAVNEKAKAIGMTSTHFANPDGYHDNDHYTTPRDLAVLGRAALSQELIAATCAKTTAVYQIVSGQFVSYVSTNAFLATYRYATGLKTGTTNEAGFCLAASAELDGRELIAIIIGADTTKSRFKYAEDLFDLAYGL